MREGRRGFVKAAVVVVALLVLYADFLFCAVRTPFFKGDPGDQGEAGVTPVKGVDYFDGAAGKDGLDGVDGVNGSDGRDGRVGAVGHAGRDAPINRLPELLLLNMSGMDESLSCRMNYSLVVSVVDPDGDNVMVSFFMDAGEGFYRIRDSFGVSGEFRAWVLLPPPESLSFLVQAWDGQKFAFAVYDYVIC